MSSTFFKNIFSTKLKKQLFTTLKKTCNFCPLLESVLGKKYFFGPLYQIQYTCRKCIIYNMLQTLKFNYTGRYIILLYQHGAKSIHIPKTSLQLLLLSNHRFLNHQKTLPCSPRDKPVKQIDAKPNLQLHEQPDNNQNYSDSREYTFLYFCPSPVRGDRSSITI